MRDCRSAARSGLNWLASGLISVYDLDMAHKPPHFQTQQGEKPGKRFRSGVRRFIVNSPVLPLSQEEIRSYVLQNDLPPQWGPQMEQEIRERLTPDGFHVSK